MAVDGFGDIDRLAIADRLAAVEALHHRQFAAVAGDQLAQPDQHVLALGRDAVLTNALVKGFARLVHGEIHVVRAAGGDLAQIALPVAGLIGDESCRTRPAR